MRYVKFQTGIILPIVILFFNSAALCSCRSSKRAVEDIRTDVKTSVVEASECDTIRSTALEVERSVDTVDIVNHQSGTVEVERDSVGRAVRVVWSRDINLTGYRSEGRRHDYSTLEMRRRFSTKSTGQTDKLQQIHTEKETQVHAPSLEEYIGLSAIGLVIVFLLYVLFVEEFWPWIRKRIFRR